MHTWARARTRKLKVRMIFILHDSFHLSNYLNYPLPSSSSQSTEPACWLNSIRMFPVRLPTGTTTALTEIFHLFPQHLQRESWGGILNLTSAVSVHIPSKSSITYHPTIRRYIPQMVTGTDRVKTIKINMKIGRGAIPNRGSRHRQMTSGDGPLQWRHASCDELCRAR